jgi:hypothetical protein
MGGQRDGEGNLMRVFASLAGVTGKGNRSGDLDGHGLG